MKIEMGKKYRLRDGPLVRVLCTDAKGTYPVVGLYEHDGEEIPESWMADGRIYENMDGLDGHDLVPAPEVTEVDVYRSVATGYIFAYEKGIVPYSRAGFTFLGSTMLTVPQP